MQGEAVRAAVAGLRAAYDALAALPVDALTGAELLDALDGLETLTCRLPVQTHRMLARLRAETTPRELGAKSWRQVLSVRWRLSASEAGRRLDDAASLASRQTLSGAPLEPVLPCTAIAQSHGVITGEHVRVLRDAMERIPGAVDAVTRSQIEVDLVRTAMGVGPKELTDTAERTLFLLDQDGPVPDDAERARRRGVTKAPQQPDGMVHLTANLTPQAWAVVEAIFATWAAPGMCHPDDPAPCLSGTPTQTQVDADHRTLGQRQHDALAQVGRHVLASGDLGQRNGLPATLIIRTTLQDLQSRAGVGVTGGGTVLPIAEVIRLAAHAIPYLAVFDRATGAALNLFRGRRVASPAQRVMLIARDGGCTKPGCTVPAYGSQVHHAARDWIRGGQTNVDELGLACGVDNRMVGDDGWTTRITAENDVEWIPPPHLDTGQARVNDYHRPERLYRPTDAAPDAREPGGPEPNTAQTTGPVTRARHHTAGQGTRPTHRGRTRPEHELGRQVPHQHYQESLGPNAFRHQSSTGSPYRPNPCARTVRTVRTVRPRVAVPRRASHDCNESPYLPTATMGAPSTRVDKACEPYLKDPPPGREPHEPMTETTSPSVRHANPQRDPR